MRRVLVARLDSVGDVLLAGPAIRAIKAGRNGHQTHVTLLCGRTGSAAAALLPGVDQTVIWDGPWIVDPAPPVTHEHISDLENQVREAGIDEAVILTSFHQSPLPLAMILRLAGVARITAASVDYAGSLLDIRLKPGEDFSEDQPEAERALGIAAAADFHLPALDDGRLAVHNLPNVAHLTGAGAGNDFGSDPDGDPDDEGDDPYVVIHPGAAVPARTWPPLHHKAAVELLIAAGYRVLVTGGPNEKELTAMVAGPDGVDLGGRTDLAGLGSILKGAIAVVTGNTGPAHLAAAVGTPVVCLFSPVVPPIRWAPYKVPLELLGDQHAPCRGSRARNCPVPGHPCLANVSPEEVVDAVVRLTAGIPSLGTRRKVRNR